MYLISLSIHIYSGKWCICVTGFLHMNIEHSLLAISLDSLYNWAHAIPISTIGIIWFTHIHIWINATNEPCNLQKQSTAPPSVTLYSTISVFILMRFNNFKSKRKTTKRKQITIWLSEKVIHLLFQKYNKFFSITSCLSNICAFRKFCSVFFFCFYSLMWILMVTPNIRNE